MASDDRSLMDGCIALVGSWILGWPVGAVRAAVAMKGWEWFVADTFGAPEIGLVETWGLFMLVSFATLQLTGPTDNDRSPYALALHSLLMSLFFSGVMFLSLLTLVSVAS